MVRQGVLLLLAAVTVVVRAQTTTTVDEITGSNWFDHRRLGQSCINRASGDTSSGAFDTCGACTNNGDIVVEPYWCRTAGQTGSACTDLDKCKNAGTCIKYTDNGAVKEACYCTPEWAGDTCETPRVKLDCTFATNHDTSIFQVTFEPWTEAAASTAFTGKVYFENKEGVPNCELDQGQTQGTDDMKWSKTITGGQSKANFIECGIAATPATSTEGAKITSKIVIQWNPLMLTTSDQLVTVTCSNPSSAEIRGSVQSVSADMALTPSATADSKTVPVVMSVKKDVTGGWQNVDSTAVGIGHDMALQFDFTANTLFTKFKVHTCWATDAVNNANPSASTGVQLVQSTGCPGTDLSVVVLPQVSSNSDATFTIPFKAFMFLTSRDANGQGQLLITCSVKLCTANDPATACRIDGTAAGENCANPTSAESLGRRRRSAPLSSDLRLGTLLRVSVTGDSNVTVETNNGNGNAGAQGAMDKANACLQNPQMQTVLAVLGLLLVLAVVALTATAVLYCRGRGNQDSRLKYVDNYAMGSSTQTLAMPKI